MGFLNTPSFVALHEDARACQPRRARRSVTALDEYRNALEARTHTFGTSEVDAEPAQFNDCRPAPADRVRREGQHKGHPVLLPKRLTVAQDAIVSRSRLDREPDRFEPVYELADVLSLPHVFSLTLPRTPQRKAALTQLRARRDQLVEQRRRVADSLPPVEAVAQ